MISDHGFVDPDQASEMLCQRAGEVVGRFALGASDVTYRELFEAVGVSLAMSAQTPEELFNPRNAFLVELFCTP